MNLSSREKGLALGTIAVLAILLVDYYVLTPFLSERDLLETQRAQILADISRGRKLVSEGKELVPKWKGMEASGLKEDPAEAESQLLHALRDWAKESGLALSSLKPDRPESKEELKEVHVQATGTGSMDGVSKFLWRAQSASFPVKVLEVQVGSRTDGTNDLALQVKLSTLYRAPQQRVAKVEKPNGGGAR